jgi:hypothetical protein
VKYWYPTTDANAEKDTTSTTSIIVTKFTRFHTLGLPNCIRYLFFSGITSNENMFLFQKLGKPNSREHQIIYVAKF